jgi:membrane protease YdiL (CAAX protease family)
LIALAVPALWLGAILCAELLTIFVSPLAGIICYLFMLLFLIVNSTAVRMYPIHRFYLALGLVPLIRIVSLAIPLSEVSLVYWYLITAIPVVVGAFAVAAVLKMRPVEIGLTVRAIGVQALVAFFGITIALVDYFILKPEPLIEALTWRDAIVPALVLLVATGFAEELVFRGVLQRAAVTLGAWGWIYVAVISSILQIGHHSVLHWLLALGVALLFGWMVKKTGSILGVSLAHGLANICLYLVFPFVF